jgi:uncharacterized OsmC-like protein
MSQSIAARWIVRVHSSGTKPLTVWCQDQLLDLKPPDQIGAVSPVEYLLVSIATCFALSCRTALAQRDRTGDEFEVIVRGSKAADLPSRLGEIELEVVFAGGLERPAEAVVEHAKRLCTVTNTLAQSLQPRFLVRADAAVRQAATDS